MLNNLGESKLDYDLQKGTDLCIDEIVKTSRHTSLQNEKFQDLLQKKKNQRDGIITEEELIDIYGKDFH